MVISGVARLLHRLSLVAVGCQWGMRHGLHTGVTFLWLAALNIYWGCLICSGFWANRNVLWADVIDGNSRRFKGHWQSPGTPNGRQMSAVWCARRLWKSQVKWPKWPHRAVSLETNEIFRDLFLVLSSYTTINYQTTLRFLRCRKMQLRSNYKKTEMLSCKKEIPHRPGLWITYL